jgi:cell division protein FtsA
MLCRDIVQPRIEEIFSFVKAEISRLGCDDLLASGAVITGGTTQLPGMTELAEEILGIPVRRGVPKGVGGLAEVVRSPTFSTAVGLVQYVMSRHHGDRVAEAPAKRGGFLSKLRRSISNAF